MKKHNETDLDYKKRLIDRISPTYCGAKWYNATIWLGSGRTTSCHHPPAHNVSVKEVVVNFKALHNTAQKKDDRRKMLAGERPEGCDYCWRIEDMGTDKISDRVFKTVRYTDEENILASNTDIDQDVDLKTLEIAFDRTCQFACSYCNPAFSTTWVKDIKVKGPYKDLTTDGRAHFTHIHEHDQLYDFHETNPYIEAFFAWWDDSLHRTLKELRITGGEPLMSGHTWKLIDWFKENKNKSNTELAINSNLGFEKKLVDRLLDSTQDIKLSIYTSNEAVGGQAEYIRDGLAWDQWLENVTYLLESKRLRNLNIMCTINALCLDSLPEFLDLVANLKRQYGRQNLHISLNIMRFPSFQGPLVLPEHLRQHYKNRLIEWQDKNRDEALFVEFELNHLERLIDYLDIVKTPHSEGFELAAHQKDFKRFYSQYDDRRNKDFSKTFSSVMQEWYNSIPE